jgi:pimeloyl-ACP methyl ester carboxylesterase
MNELKRRYGNRDFMITGYSGGGAVAALLAARRRDIAMLVTVAGNLNPPLWSRYHRLAPLSESLDPCNDASRLRRVPQYHLVGTSDRIVPPAIAHSYLEKIGNPSSARILRYPGLGHRGPWTDTWKSFLKQPSRGGK